MWKDGLCEPLQTGRTAAAALCRNLVYLCPVHACSRHSTHAISVWLPDCVLSPGAHSLCLRLQ
jgi:hypothetical protein